GGVRWAESDGVVGAGGSEVGVTGGVVGHAGGDRYDDGAGAGHSTDGDGIGCATAADGCGGGTWRGAGQGHVTGGEVGHGLAEDDGESDRRAAGRVGLGGGLIDGYRWW